MAAWRDARKHIKGLTEDHVREALHAFAPLWEELFPAEQTRIVQLLVARVDVAVDGIDIQLRIDGLAGFVQELRGPAAPDRSAA